MKGKQILFLDSTFFRSLKLILIPSCAAARGVGSLPVAAGTWTSWQVVSDEVLVWRSSAEYAEFVVASYNILWRMSPLTSTPSSVVSFIVLSLHMSSKMVTNCARARRVKDSIAVLDWKAMVFRSFERVLRLDCVKRLIADGCWGVCSTLHLHRNQLQFFFVIFRTCA